MSQGMQLIAAIRRKAMTYGDLLALRVSTCPHKRIAEVAHRLQGERIVRKTNADGLVTFRCVKR